MIEKTFFDLQRFDDEDAVLLTATGANDANVEPNDTLVAEDTTDGTQFTWKGGNSFTGSGTLAYPAKLNTQGVGLSSITKTDDTIYLDGNLNGERDRGYSFAVEGSENDWNVSLKGASNVFGVAVTSAGNIYGLDGKATVTVKNHSATNSATKINEFHEYLNGQQVYIKAAAQDTPVTIEASDFVDSDALTYTFEGANSVRVAVDNNDTAIFKGVATNVSLGTSAADGDNVTVGSYLFGGEATVTNNGNDTFNFAVKENVVVTATDRNRLHDAWVFDNRSTRDVVNLTATANDERDSVNNINTGDITAVDGFTKNATLASDDGLDNRVIVNGKTWNQITGDLNVIEFDASANATIRNLIEDENGNSNNKSGDVLVKGDADLKAQFDTITADGVIVNRNDANLNGATIQAATLQSFAANDDDLLKLATDTTYLADPTSTLNPVTVNVSGNDVGVDDVEVVLDTVGIKSIEVNKDDEDAPIKVAGDTQFDVIAGRKTFSVNTEASDVTFAVRDVVLLSPDDVYNQEDLRTKNGTLNDSVEVSQDWIDRSRTVTGDPRKGIRDKDYAIEDALVVRVNPNEENQAYTVTGGNAVFDVEDITNGANATFTINSAAVTLYNNAKVDNDNYIVTTSSLKAGVDTITGLEANDAVSVSGDADGYVAIFQPASNPNHENDETPVTFSVNGATFSVKTKFVDDNAVTVIADSGNNVTIQGIEGYELDTTEDSNKETEKDNTEKYLNKSEKAVVTVASGAVYHFKNDRDRNEVTLAAGTTAEVTLNANGDVAVNETVVDVIEDDASKRIYADRAKWNEIATVGSSTANSDLQDTVTVHHAQVYEDFYNIGNSNVSSNAIAGYASQDDEEPTETASNINIAGANANNEPAAIGEATHVSLYGGSEIGNVPINIQRNETTAVRDVTVNLTNSSAPSTVAVGTRGDVTASHNIQLSNSSTATNPSYAYLGQYATGENVVQAGGAAMIRHDGTSRASLLGGTGVDTIMGNVNDIVRGGEQGDFFYDVSGYAMDYNVTEGDVIIASRLRDLSEVNLANIRGNGNQIGFGNNEYLLTLGNINPIDTVHVKVAVMDDGGNVKNGVRDVVLANGNVLVDATATGTNGALIISNATRGDGVHAVVGSEGADTIHVGNNDVVSGAGGNDSIAIDANSFGVEVALSAGRDSVSGWHFGFDRAAGATKLNASGLQVRGRMYEDRLLISLEGAEAEMSFEDTRVLGNTDAKTMHGQFDVLVDDKKYTAIRNGDSGTGYAEVTRNDDIADFYLAEREGDLRFTQGVTENLGLIQLGSDNYQYIRKLGLYNNSKAVVLGTDDRETVRFADSVYGGGAASVGANKEVSLGGGNDVIYSGGDGFGIAGNTFIFGAGDGRDTIHSFGHYLGVNIDPDKQECDTIVLQSYNGVKAEVDVDGSTRVEFALGGAPTENEYVCVYEAPGTFNYDNKMYHVQVTDVGVDGMAKIGYSDIANLFTYDKEVSFYIGSSGEARDTLKVKNISENVEIRMDKPGTFNADGSYNTFYRGIGVVDASEETNTNISIAGSAADNMLIAGGEGTRNFLWGGAGDNTLIGGAGNDYFLYYQNSNYYTAGADPNADGNHDVIFNYSDGNYNENQDFIVLADVTIDDINVDAMTLNRTNYGITENAVTVDFKNGGSLTVDVTNQETVQFYMGDGSIYEARRDTGAWNKVK